MEWKLNRKWGRRLVGSAGLALGSVAILSTGQLVTEEFYALGKLVQLGIGTRNYDGNTTLCMSTAVAGYKRSFGSDGPPGAYEDFVRLVVPELQRRGVLLADRVPDQHHLHRLGKRSRRRGARSRPR